MKIKATLDRIPGGMMVVPLLIAKSHQHLCSGFTPNWEFHGVFICKRFKYINCAVPPLYGGTD